MFAGLLASFISGPGPSVPLPAISSCSGLSGSWRSALKCLLLSVIDVSTSTSDDFAANTCKTSFGIEPGYLAVPAEPPLCLMLPQTACLWPCLPHRVLVGLQSALQLILLLAKSV